MKKLARKIGSRFFVVIVTALMTYLVTRGLIEPDLVRDLLEQSLASAVLAVDRLMIH